MSEGRSLKGRVAVVTGASRGIGRSVAMRLADLGADVALVARSEAALRETAAEVEKRGVRSLTLPLDVSDPDAVNNAVTTVGKELGGLDILVNNAGYSHRLGPLWELPEEDYDRVFAVNTKSVYLGAKHAVPVLRGRGGGAIVNTASIGALRPRPGLTAYNATKGAVVTMTRGLAAEVAPFKIRVNAVNPVAADTGFMTGVWGESGLPDGARKLAVDGIPLGRLAEPADVAAAVLFLASAEAGFLTGVCLDVDGGRSIA